MPGSPLTELLEGPARQAGSLAHTGHRPWPVPERSWLMGQTWAKLLFAHWRVDAKQLAKHVPAGLELDRFDGSAWLGVTPFRMEGLRLRGLPALPGASSFLELNVRTYVTRGGKPGLWFLSLDASSALAVAAARRTFRLNYKHAQMEMSERDGWSDYACTRSSERDRRFRGRYRGSGDFLRPEPRSLEAFLVERYCLYAQDDVGELYRAEIHHEHWSLQAGEAELEECTIVPPDIELAGEPLLHLAARVDTVVWPLERV